MDPVDQIREIIHAGGPDTLSRIAQVLDMGERTPPPIDMVLHCPKCGWQHIDAEETKNHQWVFPTAPPDLWNNPPHRSHLCHGCGHIWRPADVPTNGVVAVKTKGRSDSPLRDAFDCLARDRDPLASRKTELEREVERLRALINTPQTQDWMRGGELEAAHQQERWGSAHDGGKAPEDWFWLLGYLSGKALAAMNAGDHEKTRHHIISSAAVLRNWHRH